eukprot:jgi/Tetstr1/443860/TSEL_031814.t1
MNRDALTDVVMFAARRETLRLVREGWVRGGLRARGASNDRSAPRTDLVESCSSIFTRSAARRQLLEEISAGLELRRAPICRDRSAPVVEGNVHVRVKRYDERQRELAELRYAAVMADALRPAMAAETDSMPVQLHASLLAQRMGAASECMRPPRDKEALAGIHHSARKVEAIAAKAPPAAAAAKPSMEGDLARMSMAAMPRRWGTPSRVVDVGAVSQVQRLALDGAT